VNQPTLFDSGPYTDPSLARTKDPLSSHDAAERMVRSGQRTGNALIVLGALATKGPCTARELTGWMWARGVRLNKPTTGDLYHEVVRRLNDLAQAGRASAALRPKRCCRVNGNVVQVWEVVEDRVKREA